MIKKLLLSKMAHQRLLSTPLYAVSAISVGTVSAIAYFYQRALNRVHSTTHRPDWSFLNYVKTETENLTSQEQSNFYRDSFKIRVPRSQLALPPLQADSDTLLLRYARAFYTSPLFKLERLILRLTSARGFRAPGQQVNDNIVETDQDILAREFQVGDTVASEVFTVTGREWNQIGLRFTLSHGKILGTSWLAVAGPETIVKELDGETSLVKSDEEEYYTFWFGTVLVPAGTTSAASLGSKFSSNSLTIQLHKLYSRMLLDMAVRNLAWMQQKQSSTVNL
ncbi:hypothetical protein K7432_007377 [Basidiobolus ranarum]|uniref:Uncharacterized protein n=1 Tax=Basidiobolus ranarum TaxID=34480 RepID=A0ABR2WTM4_9FUNG